jgi:soluble lytic murein transglycosylase-like protein
MRTISAVILASILLIPAGIVRGQDDFTFKRIKPPEAGAKRITVQVDPVEQAKRLALAAETPWVPLPPNEPAAATPVTPAAPGTPAEVAPARYAWFWDTVPTGLEAASERFPLAMSTLSKGPEGALVSAPRLQDMQELAKMHGTDILAATIGTDVSPALVLAVIGIESSGKSDAVSSAGAIGLMQLIPATAERFGVTDSTDEVQNIKGGVAYLNWLMQEFDRDPLMVLAAYNAGEGAVRANAGVPPFAETRDYVPKVLAAWQVAQGLCLTPPELMTDPCVFLVNSAGG